ncbi:response regulator transcription factor [Amycolatopsis minnesotensis]|uniref:Response regulator transcription factor n=1 Tax=Amycolatopsis minnesotensis TaxID=337894 RepID=A0ABN2SPH4_9PSEU
MRIEPSKHRGTTERGDVDLGVAMLGAIPLVRHAVGTIVTVSPGFQWLGSGGSTHHAMQACARLRPDVMLVDSVLDPMCALVRRIRSMNPAPAVVVLVDGCQRTSDYLRRAVGFGASGVLAATVSPSELLAGIRAACASGDFIDDDLAHLVGVHGEVTPPPRGCPGTLSAREHEVLTLIADGLDNQAIAGRLTVSVETVRTHVKGVLRKLDARDRTHATSRAYRLGLLSVHDTPSGPDGRSAPALVPSARRPLAAAT